MGFEIARTDAFKADVDEALTYIKEKLKSPGAASNLADALEDAFDRIKDNPFLYAISKEPILHMYECRECLVKKYGHRVCGLRRGCVSDRVLPSKAAVQSAFSRS